MENMEKSADTFSKQADELIEKKKCNRCNKMDLTTRERTIKENGMVSYYDVKVIWCDKCVGNHNRYLLSSWG